MRNTHHKTIYQETRRYFGKRSDYLSCDSLFARNPTVWEGVPKTRWLDAAIMDKAYDSDNIRKFLEKQGVEAVIPPKSNRKMLYHYDKKKYRMRQKVERFFCRIKEFRRIATRYDKLARNFMAFVHLVCAFVGFQKN